MSQTSEKNVSQLATKVRDTGNFGRAKERHTLTHRFLPRKRCDTTTEKKKLHNDFIPWPTSMYNYFCDGANWGTKPESNHF